ncbi:hypothetical protein VTN02DRAFT_6567 [Thermoascus thermophilus]
MFPQDVPSQSGAEAKGPKGRPPKQGRHGKAGRLRSVSRPLLPPAAREDEDEDESTVPIGGTVSAGARWCDRAASPASPASSTPFVVPGPGNP